VRTETKRYIKLVKNRLDALSKSLDLLLESALKDDKETILNASDEELTSICSAAAYEMSLRRACIEAEKEAQAEDEADDVWNKLPDEKRRHTTYAQILHSRKLADEFQKS
jgi:hypothetical protein